MLRADLFWTHLDGTKVFIVFKTRRHWLLRRAYRIVGVLITDPTNRLLAKSGLYGLDDIDVWDLHLDKP